MMPRSGPAWLAVSFLCGLVFAMWAEERTLHSHNGELRVTAPRLHFISGAALERLKNGAAVSDDFQLSLASGSRGNVVSRAIQRFVVSYDLWEEKYSVTKLKPSSMRGLEAPPPNERRSASHLSSEAAEAWCVDHIAVPLSGVSATDPVWVRLDIRTADQADPPSLFGESGVALSRLIEIFSRPARSDQQHWSAETGPVRLNEVRAGPMQKNRRPTPSVAT